MNWFYTALCVLPFIISTGCQSVYKYEVTDLQKDKKYSMLSSIPHFETISGCTFWDTEQQQWVTIVGTSYSLKPVYRVQLGVRKDKNFEDYRESWNNYISWYPERGTEIRERR